MLSKDLERALNESFKQARAQRHVGGSQAPRFKALLRLLVCARIVLAATEECDDADPSTTNLCNFNTTPPTCLYVLDPEYCESESDASIGSALLSAPQDCSSAGCVCCGGSGGGPSGCGRTTASTSARKRASQPSTRSSSSAGGMRGDCTATASASTPAVRRAYAATE